jgi:hypothetical protein
MIDQAKLTHAILALEQDMQVADLVTVVPVFHKDAVLVALEAMRALQAIQAALVADSLTRSPHA